MKWEYGQILCFVKAYTCITDYYVMQFQRQTHCCLLLVNILRKTFCIYAISDISAFEAKHFPFYISCNLNAKQLVSNSGFDKVNVHENFLTNTR